jgi:mobilization protein NikA
MREQPSYDSGQRWRERLPGGRNRQVKLRLTDHEYQRFQHRAHRAGVSVQLWLIDAALAALQPRRGLSAIERRAIAEECRGTARLVAAIAADAAQLAALAQASGAALPPAVAALHADAQRFGDHVQAALADRCAAASPTPTPPACQVQSAFRDAARARRHLASLSEPLHQAARTGRLADALHPDTVRQCELICARLTTDLEPVLAYAALARPAR